MIGTRSREIRAAMNRQELTVLAAADDSSRHRQVSRLLKPGRNVATLAGAQILFFLVLTQLEPRFFIIHLYQLIPHVAILILLGCGQARWAYMLGPLVSVVWLCLAFMAGLLSSAVERLRTFGNFGSAENLVALLALATAMIAVLITVLCRIHWVKEYSECAPSWRAFLISLGIVVAYYGILLRWFWDMIPNG